MLWSVCVCLFTVTLISCRLPTHRIASDGKFYSLRLSWRDLCHRRRSHRCLCSFSDLVSPRQFRVLFASSPLVWMTETGHKTKFHTHQGDKVPFFSRELLTLSEQQSSRWSVFFSNSSATIVWSIDCLFGKIHLSHCVTHTHNLVPLLRSFFFIIAHAHWFVCLFAATVNKRAPLLNAPHISQKEQPPPPPPSSAAAGRERQAEADSKVLCLDQRHHSSQVLQDIETQVLCVCVRVCVCVCVCVGSSFVCLHLSNFSFVDRLVARTFRNTQVKKIFLSAYLPSSSSSFDHPHPTAHPFSSSTFLDRLFFFCSLTFKPSLPPFFCLWTHTHTHTNLDHFLFRVWLFLVDNYWRCVFIRLLRRCLIICLVLFLIFVFAGKKLNRTHCSSLSLSLSPT